ncbi:MAG TPA: DUF4440 domain-containing protein [Chitinophagaceae bacterium]|nr:DUF4440 domain-containing protein [Chitinophagaceae bacterium]
MKPSFITVSYSMVVSLFMIACNNKAADKSESPTNNTSSFNLEKARTDIRELDDKFIADFKRGDSSAVAAHYSADAWVMPSNSEPITTENVAGFWGGVIRMGVKDFKLNITDITGNDNLIAETGKYEMYGDNNQLIDKGKYVVVWKKENGAWKIFRDIWNTSMTATPN